MRFNFAEVWAFGKVATSENASQNLEYNPAATEADRQTSSNAGAH